MTISSSLNAGIQGLSVNSTRLGTIANNIANSDTYGYKRAETDFLSLVIDGSSASFSAGGVRVIPGRDVDEQGSLISTGRSTDIAISGRGFLPVTEEVSIGDDNQSLLLTPTGSFQPDQNGILKTPGGLVLLGWPSGANGDIGAVTRQGVADLRPVQISTSQFESSPTQNVNLGVNLPANDVISGADGNGHDLTVEYFDNLGRVQVLTIRFAPNVPAVGDPPTNAWSVEVYDNSNGTEALVANFSANFLDTRGNGGALNAITNVVGYQLNADGTPLLDGGGNPVVDTTLPGYDASTGNVSINLPSGRINLNVGRSGTLTGLTQFAAEFAPGNLAKDGAAIGDLAGVELDSLGNLQAVYDTGFRQTLYQIPVADVPNPNGLQARNAQAFQLSQASGDVYLWDAGTGPVGETIGFSLMESTTDIASELTAMIETQRAYSSNAKIIQVVDEILQETNNIIR